MPMFIHYVVSALELTIFQKKNNHMSYAQIQSAWMVDLKFWKKKKNQRKIRILKY